MEVEGYILVWRVPSGSMVSQQAVRHSLPYQQLPLLPSSSFEQPVERIEVLESV